MELIIIISVIVLIYFYRKSKKKKENTPAPIISIPNKYTVHSCGSEAKLESNENDNHEYFIKLKIKGTQLGYFCYSESKNKKFSLYWRREGECPENIDGLYSSKYGNIIVLENGAIVFNTTIPLSEGRPSNRYKSASISNNGVFVVPVLVDVNKGDSIIKFGSIDKGFFGLFPVSSFTDKVFISENGIYSVVQADACWNIFDVQDCILIGSIDSKYYHSSDIEIFENEKQVYFWYEGKAIVYDFTGEVINENQKLEILMDAADKGVFDYFLTAYYLFKETKDDIHAEKLIDSISKINTANPDVSNSRKSKACRMLGEYYEDDKIQVALKYFNMAIEYNPKAGVKRKIKELQEKTNKQK